MTRPTALTDLVVLKFGSSVLRTEEDLPTAVSEIYRHLRAGHRVLAVVSAFAGTTDRLLARARYYCETPHPAAVSALLATGELTSTALLALHLERAGIPVRLLDVRQVGFVTRGPVLDAEPADVRADVLARALDEAPVAVLPGFIGTDEHGQTTLLGRGGSDLTALFLAQRLGAGRCRLLKDVDGLFERDPAGGGPLPRNFAEISWQDALRLDPRVIQPKGVRFAHKHELAFEVGAVESRGGTRVGELATRHGEPPPATAPRPLRVCLLGLGTVGLGLYRLLERNPKFIVVRVAVTDPSKHVHEGIPRGLLVDNAWEAVETPHDVLVELMGGNTPALALLEAALRAGRSAITANKGVVAVHGDRLVELARAYGGRFLYSASVGGAVPAIEAVERIARAGKVVSIQGVLNGTTNFVLERMAGGSTLDHAVADAQARGLAEADPSLDLNGFDSACKLAILVRHAFGERLDLTAIEREGIDELTPELVKARTPPGTALRLVASCRATDEGLACSVAPVALPLEHPLAGTAGEENRVVVETADGHMFALCGRGAGRWPTAESVYADLATLAMRDPAPAPTSASGERLGAARRQLESHA